MLQFGSWIPSRHDAIDTDSVDRIVKTGISPALSDCGWRKCFVKDISKPNEELIERLLRGRSKLVRFHNSAAGLQAIGNECFAQYVVDPEVRV